MAESVDHANGWVGCLLPATMAAVRRQNAKTLGSESLRQRDQMAVQTLEYKRGIAWR